MSRRSEDIFLDELDKGIASVIKNALNEIDEGNCDRAWELLKPLVNKKDKAAIFYASSFGITGEQIAAFEGRRINQLQQSAGYGYAPAIHELAVYYDNGDLVPRDAEKAAQLFKHAAEKGHPHSQWIYGLDLLYGKNGIDRNEELGLDYIKKSASAKFEGALESMSEFYETGQFGLQIDVDKARYFKNQLNDEDILGY
ncbi:MAG: hypothetical protein M0P19_12050 [Nevskia sp.]|jgi:TPR repeat protein|nr:hypothetical protein [Nevskia sp.]MCK9386315.1 hypothetical protein [Nevskia sp.]